MLIAPKTLDTGLGIIRAALIVVAALSCHQQSNALMLIFHLTTGMARKNTRTHTNTHTHTHIYIYTYIHIIIIYMCVCVCVSLYIHIH